MNYFKKLLVFVSFIRLRLHSRIQLRKVVQHGKNNVFGKIYIVNPRNVEIGDGCTFNHCTYINATNPIVIGNDVTLSAGVKILSTGIDYIEWANHNKRHTKDHTIRIGDHVWIGANSLILEGVNISGKYVVIAAGSIVNKDITQDYSIFGGCPIKLIKPFSSYVVDINEHDSIYE